MLFKSVDQRSESGNALFLVLIAVVLFAALSFAITQSNRGGSGVNRENAQMSASGIMQAVSALTEAHIRLNLRGYSATGEILMIGPMDAQYNSNAENAKRNLVHPDGGGAPFSVPPPSWVSTVIPPTPANPMSNWTLARKQVLNVGSTLLESVILLSDVLENVCRQFNVAYTGNDDIPTLTVSEANLLVEASGVSEDAAETLSGQHSACVKPSDNDRYTVYHVLLQDDGSTP